MLNRNDVVDLYRLILDREPESDQVINEKRRGDSLKSIAIDMLKSDEFISNNNEVLLTFISDN